MDDYKRLKTGEVLKDFSHCNLARADLILQRIEDHRCGKNVTTIPKRGIGWIDEGIISGGQKKYPRNWDDLNGYSELIEIGRSSSGTGPFLHMLDYFSRPVRDNDIKDLVLEICSSISWTQFKSFDAFVDNFGLGILRAYISCEVTYETDRMNATTAVGRKIAEELHGGGKMDGIKFMEAVWNGAVRGVVAGSAGCFELNGFNANITHGRELCGLPTVKGARLKHETYRTKDGRDFDSTSVGGGGANYFRKYYDYQSDTSENSFWVDKRSGERVELTVCNTPTEELRKSGMVKMLVVTGINRDDNTRRILRACVWLRGREAARSEEKWPEAAEEVEIVVFARDSEPASDPAADIASKSIHKNCWCCPFSL